ncbi:nuclear movement protein nudC [Carpediemonas membranifera]|uniref:Nuclear movement protein nudC n=1 Tax=Carpediemonas membranifera TaxID=201153 RepID=A0A8J6AWR2_9EUKA|nr:nuclear movement protein nudC [Carpediemonas membranifera]|eukprot:KAG9396088.1 nuclear movement protein nudC [Carpediemonas membranifera]
MASRGGVGKGYFWDQSLDEVSIEIKLPEPASSKQIAFAIKPKHLMIGVKGQEPIIDGELHFTVDVDETVWTLESPTSLCVYLPKIKKQHWWPAVIVGEEERDPTKIAPEEATLSDLDPSMRATVEKMMVEQQQKQSNAARFEAFKAAHPELDFSGAKVNFGE